MTPLQAANRLEAGGLVVGPDWHAVHEAAQAADGVRAWDWLHAICHRIEGDDWNADYWCRRAGREPGTRDAATELADLRTWLERQGGAAADGSRPS